MRLQAQRKYSTVVLHRTRTDPTRLLHCSQQAWYTPLMLAAVTNVDVGKHIGLAHSTVSRIRSGDRVPSLDVMMTIEQRYEWGIADQARARAAGTYHEEFEKILIAKHGRFAFA